MKRASTRDVALRAGVSKTTVSHVINQTRVVEESTRQRVLQAIAELGYRPNLLARSLTTNQTGIIGMLISDSSNYFFGQAIQGVEGVLLPENYGLMVCDTQNMLDLEEHYLNLLLSQRVDGIIAAAASQRWVELYRADEQRTPVVFMDRCFENMDWPFVGVDNVDGAYQGVRHLIDGGHTTIGLLAGYELLSTMRDRQAGYEKALVEAGLPVCADWIVRSGLTIEDGRRAMCQLLSAPERPQAAFINNSMLAMGALRGLHDAGLRCPDDMRLVAFDDHPWTEVSDPPLTVVRQPTIQMGATAAQILLGLTHDEHQTPADTRIILPCELVVRCSSQRPDCHAP